MGDNYLLTIGTMVLLSMFVMNTNRMFFQNNIIISESEYVITATALAQTVLDEMKTKKFDEKTISNAVFDPDSLSTTLGPETGETIVQPDTSGMTLYESMINYDDIDDYNGYIRSVDTPYVEDFTISVVVSFADPMDPETTSGSGTFCKIVEISASSPYISIPITLKYAFTY